MPTCKNCQDYVSEDDWEANGHLCSACARFNVLDPDMTITQVMKDSTKKAEKMLKKSDKKKKK